jgi:hypothetical protein
MVNALLLGLVIAVALGLVPAAAPLARADAPEVLAVGVPRPLQLAVDGRVLLVLSPGLLGESAGEIYRVPLDGAVPFDLAGQPRIRIPFAAEGGTTLGSLALDATTDTLYLGEENGKRLWRLGSDGRLVLYATGLRRLQGGSTLVFDSVGRLLVVDYADPFVSRSDERATPGLEQLREEDYWGPLVFRVDLDPGFALPRRFSNLLPLWPRAVAGRASGGLLPYVISVAPLPRNELLLLTATGDLHRLSSDGAFTLVARLPRGQYNRTNIAAAPDGTAYVSGGFHSGQIFRVTPDGGVSVVASGLADPAGVALDARGVLYIAESAQHRILRIRRP